MLIPLPTDSMQQSIVVVFLGRELPVFVPGAGNAMPSAVSHGHFFADLAAAIKASLDGGAHVAFVDDLRPTTRTVRNNSIQESPRKPNQSCSLSSQVASDERVATARVNVGHEQRFGISKPNYGAYAVSVNRNSSDKCCVPKPKAASPWLKQLGDNIRRERIAKDLSQQQLAEMADLNIRNVQRIEAGEIDVLLRTTVRIRKALGCPLEKLMPKDS